MTETETKTSESQRYLKKLLEDYGDALKILNEERHPVVGREDVLQLLNEFTERPNTPSAILIGGAGSGKTAVVKELKKRLREQKENVEFYSLSLGKLAQDGEGVLKTRIASIHDRMREYEELRTLEISDFKVYLFIDEFHMVQNIFTGITKIGGELVKEPLSGGNVRFIAATTSQEFMDYIETDDALTRRLKPIMLSEVGSAEVKKILRTWLNTASSRKGLEASKKVSEQVSDEILDMIIDANERFRKDDSVCEPSKSLDILESIVGMMSVRKVSASKDLVVEVFRKSYKIDLEKVIDFDHTMSVIRKEVRGQPLAKYMMEDILLEVKFKFESQGRPISALLIGSTGVGKTQLIKALNKGLNRGQNKLVRINGHDYSTKDSEPAFRRQVGREANMDRSAIFLIDEIEKAHKDVLNSLLPMLDDGTVTYQEEDTANNKRTKSIGLQNTMFFGTSNAGAELFDDLNKFAFYKKDLDETNYEEMSDEMDKYWFEKKPQVLNALKSQKLKPEFIARWQHIVPLMPLDTMTMIQITSDHVTEERIKLRKRYNIDLQLGKAKNWKESIGQPYIASDVIMYIVIERSSQLDTTAGGARNVKNLVKDLLIRPTLRAMMKNPECDVFVAKVSDDSRLVSDGAAKGDGKIEVIPKDEYLEERKKQEEVQATKTGGGIA